jgi:serine/threonine-protein kinase PpkA
MLHRFILEHAAISRIDHPGVARIYDQGITDELLYIAMEYFPGGDLKQRIERGLRPAQTLKITREILGALAAIHSHAIVHRDIKPANIMFRQDGAAVLLDFGIAKDLESNATLTQDGHIVGSPSYISPEQIKGEPCDGRSDLYSLGMMFYEMLSGRKAYVRGDFREILSDHVSAPIPKLPEPLARYQPFFDKLAAKKPQDRYAGAAEALTALERL